MSLASDFMTAEQALKGFKQGGPGGAVIAVAKNQANIQAWRGSRDLVRTALDDDTDKKNTYVSVGGPIIKRAMDILEKRASPALRYPLRQVTRSVKTGKLRMNDVKSALSGSTLTKTPTSRLGMPVNRTAK